MRVIGNTERDAELESAGASLLGSFGPRLPRTLYILAAGGLAGFPFDALRHDGRFLAQDHDIVNLMSLEGLGAPPGGRRDDSALRRVFLAGDPVGGAVGLPGASQEIDIIAGLFSDRDVTVVRGNGLRPEMLLDSRYARADLFHFAGHGEINLEYPELSRLMLSGNEAYLTPLEIGRVPLAAGLVTLSACETTGVNRFIFDSNMGFVSEFLQAGAGAVVASLWPVSDAFARNFMQDFYTLLLRGASIRSALAEAKRRQLARDEQSSLYWPAFQLYLR